MLYTRNLSKMVFDKNFGKFDELIIISGYVGASQVTEALKLNKKLRILYGMAPSGISGPNHQIFSRTDKRKENVEIFYSLPGNSVHSKCYIWKDNGKMVRALVGSANFTNSGLNTPEKEILVDIDPSFFGELEQYIKYVFSDKGAERCSLHSLKTRVTSITKAAQLDPKQLIIKKEAGKVKTIRISLLDRSGKVQPAHGLNWGMSAGHVKPNDSCIVIRKVAIKTGFFKPKESEQTFIDGVWDDGTTMELQEEGNQTELGLLYPKQLASAKSKEILGKYIRKRLGVREGKRITVEDLKKYGKTFIDVTCLDDGSYYLDYSKPKK